MASLKELKSSILSVQSTKRITSAMKMVASAKMKKATDSGIVKPYAEEMGKMIANLQKVRHQLIHCWLVLVRIKFTCWWLFHQTADCVVGLIQTLPVVWQRMLKILKKMVKLLNC